MWRSQVDGCKPSIAWQQQWIEGSSGVAAAHWLIAPPPGLGGYLSFSRGISQSSSCWQAADDPFSMLCARIVLLASSMQRPEADFLPEAQPVRKTRWYELSSHHAPRTRRARLRISKLTDKPFRRLHIAAHAESHTPATKTAGHIQTRQARSRRSIGFVHMCRRAISTIHPLVQQA